jgi:hypothetical protein
MKRINWIETLLLPCAVAILNTATLSLWLKWLIRQGQEDRPAPLLSPLLMLLVIVAGAFITRFTLNRLGPAAHPIPLLPGDPGPQARRIVVVSGFIAIVLTLWLTYGWQFPFAYLRGLLLWGHFISPELITLLAAGYLWWRGLSLGLSRIPYDDLERAFYGGIVSLALVLGFNRYYPFLAPSEIILPVIAFFGAGLSALALASFERARRQHSEATGAWLNFNRHWLVTVGGVIVAILVGGFALLALVAPETVARLRVFIAPLIDFLNPGVRILLGFVLVLLVIIVTPIFMLAEWLANRLLQNFKFPQLPTLPGGFAQNVQQLLDRIFRSPAFQISSRSLTVGLVLLFFALLFALAIRHFFKMASKDLDETRESVLSRELLLNQLRNLFARPKLARPPAPGPPYLPLAGAPDDPRLIARRAYQAMLEWAAHRGFARLAGQTPQRYSEILSQAVPQGKEMLTTITNAYIPARYASAPPSLSKAQQAQAAAEQLAKLSSDKS